LGRAIFTFPLDRPRPLGSGDDDLVIDFDLPRFTLAPDGQVVPALREGDKTGLADLGRHENKKYKGAISGLAGTAPELTFVLNQTNGDPKTPFTVRTDANTAIFNDGNAPNPTLANNTFVEVRGVFDTGTNVLRATEIKIKSPGDQENDPEVKGAPSQIDAAAGAFTLSTVRVRGFVPTQTTVRVVTTPSTFYRADSGAPITATDFFAALATAPLVEVEGAYNPITNTLTARKAKLDTGKRGARGRGAGPRRGRQRRRRHADPDGPGGVGRLFADERHGPRCDRGEHRLPAEKRRQRHGLERGVLFQPDGCKHRQGQRHLRQRHHHRSPFGNPRGQQRRRQIASIRCREQIGPPVRNRRPDFAPSLLRDRLSDPAVFPRFPCSD
jgi:hypothetical protein